MGSPLNLLQSFPYLEAREIQKRVLQELGEHWADYDCFVIHAPTAFGKTALARTLQNAFHSVSVITPTNQLVTQFREEFPDTCTLSRLDSYRCEEWQRPCAVTRGKLRSFCKGCPAGRDLSTAKYRNGPGVYNYHTYLSQKLHRSVLVVDEAHNLIPFIRERMAVTMWHHDFKYPLNMRSLPQIQTWVRGLSPTMRKKKKVTMLEDAALSPRPQWIPGRGKEWFNGKGTIRGEPEERDCLKLLPVDIRGAPAFFWPREVEKVVLLSATISHKDIQALGLDRKRVLYINCESPIPSSSRPIVSQALTTVNHGNLRDATDLMGNYIRDVLAPTHLGQKGMIHATYKQAEILRHTLGSDPRYLFHDRSTKGDVYARFRAASPESGTVLVASGMYEGVDLALDAGRWQVIVKIPWPNLGSPSVKYLADRDSAWYTWEALKMTMQASGRICRTPGDFGVTYVLDSSFERLIREGIGNKLVPHWYLDGIEAGGGM